MSKVMRQQIAKHMEMLKRKENVQCLLRCASLNIASRYVCHMDVFANKESMLQNTKKPVWLKFIVCCIIRKFEQWTRINNPTHSPMHGRLFLVARPFSSHIARVFIRVLKSQCLAWWPFFACMVCVLYVATNLAHSLSLSVAHSLILCTPDHYNAIQFSIVILFRYVSRLVSPRNNKNISNYSNSRSSTDKQQREKNNMQIHSSEMESLHIFNSKIKYLFKFKTATVGTVAK